MFANMLDTFGDWIAGQVTTFLDFIVYILGQNVVLTGELIAWEPWVRLQTVTQVGAGAILLGIVAFTVAARYLAEIAPSTETVGAYAVKSIISAALIWSSAGIVRFVVEYGARLQSDFLIATRIQAGDLTGGQQLVEHLTTVISPVVVVGVATGPGGGAASAVLLIAIIALAFGIMFVIIFWQMTRRTGEMAISAILAPFALTNFQSPDQMVIKHWGRHLVGMVFTHALQTALFMITLRAVILGIPELGGGGIFALVITMVLGAATISVPQILDGYIHKLAPTGAAGTGMQAASTLAILSRMR